MKKIYVLSDCNCIKMGHLGYTKPSKTNFIVIVSVTVNFRSQQQTMIESFEVTEKSHLTEEHDYILMHEFSAEIATESKKELLVAPIRYDRETPYISTLDILNAIRITIPRAIM